ncbi:MAG: ABC transporter permease [Clostridia bacterium]
MKTREYMRLAKISLKSRKKTTRSTVVGIVFGLIMIVPILFLGLGLNGDLQKQINKTPQLLYMNMPYALESYNLNDSYPKYESDKETHLTKTYDQIIGSKHGAEIEALDCEKIIYTPLLNNNLNFFTGMIGTSINGAEASSHTRYSIDKSELKSIEDDGKLKANLSLTSVVDLKKNANFVPSNIVDPFVPGFDKSLSGDGKGQVVVSEALLKTIGKTPADVYGKKLTIEYDDIVNVSNSDWSGATKQGFYPNISMSYDDDNDPNNSLGGNSIQDVPTRNLFSDYEIVGVLAEKHNKTFSSADHIMGSSMILSRASLGTSNTIQKKPTFRHTITASGFGNAVVTYAYSVAEMNALAEYVTIGTYVYSNFTKAMYKEGANDIICFYQLENALVLGKNYGDLNSKIVKISDSLKGAYEEKPVNGVKMQFASEAYISYNMIYTIFSYLALILSTVGGIVFFSAMVNLFNTIMHSVGARKNYLGVMRAIGAENNVIPKLYMFETLSIFARALLWVALIGGAICVGIKIGIDYLFKYIGDGLGLKLAIGWEYIAIVFAIIVVVLMFFGWLFSFACSYKVSKQPIMQVLEG